MFVFLRQISTPESGLLYVESNLCFLDSLVQLVARALPEMLSVLSTLDQVPGSESREAVLEFKRVLESVSNPAGQPVELSQLGELLSKVCSCFSVGEQENPLELWRWISGWIDTNVSNLDFLEAREQSSSVCSTCHTASAGGLDMKREITIGLGRLKPTEKGVGIGRLLKEEFISTVEEVEDYVCASDQCQAHQRREEIIAKHGKAELPDLTGRREVAILGSPSILVVQLNRLRLSGSKTLRHVLLEVEEIHVINGGSYVLMGIQRHYGTSISSGHWTTLVRDEKYPNSTWHEYSKMTVKEVPVGQVSSRDAVVLVFRKLEVSEVFRFMCDTP